MYTNKTDEYRCTLCNKEIELEKNLTGLVINDDIFICQHCCSTNPKNMLLDWINQKTDNAPNFRPIVSWLEDRKL
ncbi:MAG: hypothetical protein ACLFPQ_00195 [Candidatus Woesearchaeota archaeon]